MPRKGAHFRKGTGTPQRLPLCNSSPEQARALQFFIERTVTQLTGYFDSSFWKRHVVRLACAEASVLHATVSLAAYHESYLHRDVGQLYVESEFAARQLDQALRKTVQKVNGPEWLDVYVTSCLLFMSIEMVRGRYASAIRLFKSGRKMLLHCAPKRYSSDKSLDLEAHKTLSTARDMFTHLEMQIAALVGDVDPELWISSADSLIAQDDVIETEFGSLEEARSVLLRICAGIVADPGRMQTDVHDARLDMWSRALEKYQAASPRTVALLQMQKRYMGVILLRWGQEESVLREIVELAELITGDGTRAAFHQELGLTPALYAVFIRSHVMETRLRAMEVLRATRLQEGVWSGELALRTLEKVLALEGGDAGEQKVSKVKIHFSAEDDAAVLQIGVGEGQVLEALQW